MLSLIETFLTFLTAVVNVCFPSCCRKPPSDETSSKRKRKRRYSITKTTTETTTIESIGDPVTEVE